MRNITFSFWEFVKQLSTRTAKRTGGRISQKQFPFRAAGQEKLATQQQSH